MVPNYYLLNAYFNKVIFRSFKVIYSKTFNNYRSLVVKMLLKSIFTLYIKAEYGS